MLRFKESRFTSSGGPYTFADMDVGVPASDRRIIIAYALFDGVLSVDITVGGVSAANVHAHARPTNSFGTKTVELPAGETADVVITPDNSESPTGCVAAIWRATAMPSMTTVDTFEGTLTGGSEHTLDTVDDGILLALQMRSSGDPNWGGVVERFRHGSFSGADHAPTEAPSRTVTTDPLVNINTAWLLASFDSGGAPGPDDYALDLAATVSASIGVTLVAPGEDADTHITQERSCPIPGLGSEACITGRTAVPPGYGQILCGQAEYEDPCD